MKDVCMLHTDGACSGNPGPGGWGAWWEDETGQHEVLGGESATTNNRMELLAAIHALSVMPEGRAVCVRTDSQYVIKGVTEWRKGWERNNWLTAKKEPVKNTDLWRLLLAQVDRTHSKFEWVRGHNGDVANERADALAQEGLRLARYNKEKSAHVLRAVGPSRKLPGVIR